MFSYESTLSLSPVHTFRNSKEETTRLIAGLAAREAELAKIVQGGTYVRTMEDFGMEIRKKIKIKIKMKTKKIIKRTFVEMKIKIETKTKS